MSKKRAIDSRLRCFLLPFMLLTIALVLMTSLYIRIESVRSHNLAVATVGARNIFRMIVLTRQWNAEQGGLYVFTSDKIQPNPYLKHPQRDLTLPDQRTLTMLNPAYMTRQLAELAAQDEQLHLRLHITSLNPIRPDNRADAWESAALQGFDNGQQERVGIEELDGQPYLRYMAPLIVTPACLACHAKQGYQLNDVRGGISVSLQYQPIAEAIAKEIRASIITYGLFYALLVLISWGLIELLARRWRALDDTIAMLQETRNELLETEKMASLGRLVAGFAHELNTPVGVAVGAISHGDISINNLEGLIHQEEVTEQELTGLLANLRESHYLALANLRRAADLVQRFKRTSIDRSSLEKRDYQLAELIQDVLSALHNLLKRAPVSIEIDCPSELRLYGAPGLLEQVLTNLINNSLNHGFDEGRRAGLISIHAERSAAGHLLLDYQDNGVGMNETVRRQAFEPFFTTRRDHGGSGLGLYIIYNIVTQQLAGTIHISSSPDAGVCFHIDCPIETAPYRESPR